MHIQSFPVQTTKSPHHLNQRAQNPHVPRACQPTATQEHPTLRSRSRRHSDSRRDSTGIRQGMNTYGSYGSISQSKNDLSESAGSVPARDRGRDCLIRQGEIMSKKYYRPFGDNKQGWKITVPAIVKRADIYQFVYHEDGRLEYIPKVV